MPISRTGRSRRRERCLMGCVGCQRHTTCATTSSTWRSDRARVLAARGVGGSLATDLGCAIQMRTVADRPLGLFLSSGIDSSAVACRLAGMGHTGCKHSLRGSRERALMRARRARDSGASRVCRTFRSISRIALWTISPASLPISTNRLRTRAACRCGNWPGRRRAHVKVVLGGDGGDELFGGYKRYAKHLRTRWRRGIVLPWLRTPRGDRRSRMAAGSRGTAARLAIRVCVAVFRIEAPPTQVSATRSRATAALLAHAGRHRAAPTSRPCSKSTA